MFGALEFSEKMVGYGIQPIIGCEVAIDFGDQDPNARNALNAVTPRIVLLAAQERGYQQPDEAELARVSGNAGQSRAAHQARNGCWRRPKT